MIGLFGKHIVVTRALNQSAGMIQQLEHHQAIPLVYPCVQILPPAASEELDRQVVALYQEAFDWLVLTSQNAVQAIQIRRKALGIGLPLPKSLKCAVIGPSTAATAQELLGVLPDAVPQVYNAKTLSRQLQHCAGQKVLLPQADIARPDLREDLERSGAAVVSLVAYRTQKGQGGVNLPDYGRQKKIDAVTFASPSAVRFFKERFLEEGGDMHMLSSSVIACIGNVTEGAAIEAGFKAPLVPKQYTTESLLQALSRQFLASV